jgi:hypothetical protein
MGVFGNLLGQGLGALGEGIFGKTDGIDGQRLGGSIGNWLPFARGGVVPARAYQRGGRVNRPRKSKKKGKSRK